MSLPDCMMPDGGDACAAYHELVMGNATLKAENDRLREALDRNVHQIHKVKYDDKGHRCSWRSAAEAMIVRSKQALEGSDE